MYDKAHKHYHLLHTVEPVVLWNSLYFTNNNNNKNI